MFVDKVQISVKAGKGGDGVVSWRHERYIDRGGPDGGDGGDGGDVLVRATNAVNTLASFRHKQVIEAKPGGSGSKQRKHGANGDDVVIKVPTGTQVKNGDELIADLIQPGQEAVIAFGGKGGFGNAHFKSSTRQAPRVAEKGERGEQFDLDLELKLIADVGLVGLPNAGKSTFLSVVSNAKPRIADYPFTTLEPNLGVADVDSDSLLIADIPGLIEGAAQGKGLGDEFLRHIERTAVIIHLVDGYEDDVAGVYKTIQKELKDYKIDLSDKPQIVVLSKTDGLEDKVVKQKLKQLQKVSKSKDVLTMSAHTKEGVPEVLRAALKQVKTVRLVPQARDQEDENAPIVMTLSDEDRWEVEPYGDNWMVTGKKIERFAGRTDFENEAGVDRLHDIMRKMGILHALSRQGAEAGQTVQIGAHPEQKIKL